MIYNMNGESYNVLVIKKRIKNIYFRINDNLEIVLSLPTYFPLNKIYNLLDDNQKSLNKLINIKKKEIENEKYFYYLGNKYNIIYDKKVKKPYFENENFYVRDDEQKNKFYLSEVKRIFPIRVKQITSDFKNLPDFSLKYRKMKTRWGVCNYASNTITLNTLLLKKEPTLLDYVIIHELCHFYHHDHSKYFWQEVEKHYPYYKMARKMLKEV